MRDRIASGHLIRLVRFDANTLYVLLTNAMIQRCY